MKKYNIEYALLIEFVEWCEKNGKTEWMGYQGAKERVISEFLEYKNSEKDESI